jgi:hypothetical protein
MSFVSLSQAYKIAPSRRDAARAHAPAPLEVSPTNPDARDGRHADGDSGHDRDGDDGRDRDCDSARRSPLMRALMRALQAPPASNPQADLALERALIAFARALSLASSDAGAVAQPAAVRADEAARRRVSHEDALLDAFAALQLTTARPAAASRTALQTQLGAFLRDLARQLHIDDERAGEATQPGSLISVHA